MRLSPRSPMRPPARSPTCPYARIPAYPHTRIPRTRMPHTARPRSFPCGRTNRLPPMSAIGQSQAGPQGTSRYAARAAAFCSAILFTAASARTGAVRFPPFPFCRRRQNCAAALCPGERPAREPEQEHILKKARVRILCRIRTRTAIIIGEALSSYVALSGPRYTAHSGFSSGSLAQPASIRRSISSNGSRPLSAS